MRKQYLFKSFMVSFKMQNHKNGMFSYFLSGLGQRFIRKKLVHTMICHDSEIVLPGRISGKFGIIIQLMQTARRKSSHRIKYKLLVQY